MLTQTNHGKPKPNQQALDWGGWSLQVGRNDEGTFGVWTFRGQPVVKVRAANA
jgi:hypothetical protein